jgi:hypothetical protein
MTPLVPQITITTLFAGSLEGPTLGVSLVVIGLLVVLLVLREALRPAAPPLRSRGVWTQALDLAIYPLLVAFCQIIVMRLVAILT